MKEFIQGVLMNQGQIGDRKTCTFGGAWTSVAAVLTIGQ